MKRILLLIVVTCNCVLPTPYGGVDGPVTKLPAALPDAVNDQRCKSEGRTTTMPLAVDEEDDEEDETELPEPLDTELPDPEDTELPDPLDTEEPLPLETELPVPEETDDILDPVPDETDDDTEEPLPLDTELSLDTDEPVPTCARAVGGQSGSAVKNADNRTAQDVRRR